MPEEYSHRFPNRMVASARSRAKISGHRAGEVAQKILPLRSLGSSLGRVGTWYKNNFVKAAWWRSTANVSLLYGFAYGVADGVVNGQIPLAKMIGSRGLATAFNIAGAAYIYQVGHAWALRRMGITEASSPAHRFAANVAFALPMDMCWNIAIFGANKITPFWPSVTLATVLGLPVFIGVLQVNAALNYMATSDRKQLEIFSQRSAEQMKQLTGSPRRGKLLYGTALTAMALGTAAAWIWGPKLNSYLLGMASPAAQVANP